jgi:hypothetical protein
MNKTLSLIEEENENDEDFNTNEYVHEDDIHSEI